MDEMRMRVAVLGGTKFIGAAITEDLLSAGHDVLVVHRGVTERSDLPDVRHAHADRGDVEAVSAAFAGFAADAVVDTCAYTTADADTGVSAVAGRRCVVLSSMDAYRAFASVHAGVETDPLPLDEDAPTRTRRYLFREWDRHPSGIDPYDYENLDVEDRYLPAGATVLRLPMVYGERDPVRREEFVLRRVRAGRPRIPIGAGTWLWTRGWVRDVARAVRLCIEHDDLGGQVLNVGETRTTSIAGWARAILAAAGADVELVPVPDEALPEDLQVTASQPQHLLVSSARIRSLLGWTDSDPDEALARSVGWHLAHPPADPDTDFTADDTALAQAHA